MHKDFIRSVKFDPKEAPVGYFAVRKAEAKPEDGSNICRACEWRKECQKPETDFLTPGHRCMPDARNDGYSVLFKRSASTHQ